MKIAIASDNKMVSPHFGHCEGFTVYKVNSNKIEDESFIANPGHKPGFLPVFLKEKEVDIIIAGGMGQRAQQLFAEKNIKVIVGAEGNCDKIINKYINDELQSTNDVCNRHMNEGSCG